MPHFAPRGAEIYGSIRAGEYDGVFRLFAADDAGIAFLVFQHDARRRRSVILYPIFAFAAAAPARLYEVLVFHAREQFFQVGRANDARVLFRLDFSSMFF